MSGIIDTIRYGERFSALQRAEIAEIAGSRSRYAAPYRQVSVLFNEPKLLKSTLTATRC